MEFADANLLVQILRNNAPVDTGTLQKYGIQAVQVIPGGWRVQVGINNQFESGRNPSKYVWYTEYKNSSKGWIKKSVQQWARLMMQKYGQ